MVTWMSNIIYHFKDVFFFSKQKTIPVLDEEDSSVGTIVRTFNEDGFLEEEQIRKGTFYAFQNHAGKTTLSFAVKKQGLKAFLGYAYTFYLHDANEQFQLEDAKGLIYLYFHVKGKIKGKKFEAHEDWDGNITLKWDKTIFGKIKVDTYTYKIEVEIVNNTVAPLLLTPGFVSLIYCMYRIYDTETAVINELLDYIT